MISKNIKFKEKILNIEHLDLKIIYCVINIQYIIFL
jgi:hypothetical protein